MKYVWYVGQIVFFVLAVISTFAKDGNQFQFLILSFQMVILFRLEQQVSG